MWYSLIKTLPVVRNKNLSNIKNITRYFVKEVGNLLM